MTDTRPPFEEAPALKRFSMHVRHGFFGRQRRRLHRRLQIAQLRPRLGRRTGEGAREPPPRLPRARRHRRTISPRRARSTPPKPSSPTRPFEPNERPECDALVTKRPGLLLGVLAADCAPIVHLRSAQRRHRRDPRRLARRCRRRHRKRGRGDGPARRRSRRRWPPASAPACRNPPSKSAPISPTPCSTQRRGPKHLFEPGAGDRQFFDLKRYCLGRLARAGRRPHGRAGRRHAHPAGRLFLPSPLGEGRRARLRTQHDRHHAAGLMRQSPATCTFR